MFRRAPDSRNGLRAATCSLLATIAVCSLWAIALAQQKADSSTPTQTNKPSNAPGPIKFGDVTFSGSLRARVENWHWFETSAADPNYTFGASLLRLSLAQQKPKLDWQVEVAVPILINLPENSIAPAPQGQLGLGASYFAASGK